MKVSTKYENDLPRNADGHTCVIELSARESAMLQDLLYDAYHTLEERSDTHSDARAYFARRLVEAVGKARVEMLRGVTVEAIRTGRPLRDGH